MRNNNAKGITLIALVITIIVLLILAGVTINLTLGENGIFRVAEQAAKNYKDAEQQELGLLDQFNSNLEEITDFDNLKQYVASEGVNKPKILDGMTPIKFILPTEDNPIGSVDPTTEEDESWYSYTTTDKQWANAQTKDGSMWVWIPRYAYKINSATETCDVVFLIGTTDNYYDANGNIQTAKRAKSADEIVDTTVGYTVHPAFTDETSIQYANGGWDEELTGIWVAKFEAAYADGDVAVETRRNSADVRPSSVNYTETKIWAPSVEVGIEGWVTARNYKDGEYAEKNGDTYEWKNGIQTAIKYPTFQPVSYSMNYISISDAYNISRVLTENKNDINKNIYGLNSSNADSHLIKNSEWGAVAYLCKSDYGIGYDNIYLNNVCLNNSVTSVYVLTGCCGISEDSDIQLTGIEEIDEEPINLYLWNKANGGAASTTGNMYGVYDMSGGAWEYTAGYVANSHAVSQTYGASLIWSGNTLKTISTKYTTVYPNDGDVDNLSSIDINVTSAANYNKNTRIYGDSVRESSEEGVGTTGWNSDHSFFWSLDRMFSLRGGGYGEKANAGVTAFFLSEGIAGYNGGFRAVVVAQ